MATTLGVNANARTAHIQKGLETMTELEKGITDWLAEKIVGDGDGVDQVIELGDNRLAYIDLEEGAIFIITVCEGTVIPKPPRGDEIGIG
jgi:hypothetical protein